MQRRLLLGQLSQGLPRQRRLALRRPMLEQPTLRRLRQRWVGLRGPLPLEPLPLPLEPLPLGLELLLLGQGRGRGLQRLVLTLASVRAHPPVVLQQL